MNVFRYVEGNNGTLKFNYRPTQNLSNRKVYHRLEGYINMSPSITQESWSIYIILSILLIRLLRENFSMK